MKPDRDTQKRLDALSRAVAPRLFADDGLHIPEQVKEQWNVLVEADENTELSPLDISLFILNSLADGEESEADLLQRNMGVDYDRSKSKELVLEAIARLLAEGYISERAGDGGDKKGCPLFELTERGKKLVGHSL